MSTETKEVPKEFVIYVLRAVCSICEKHATADAEVVDGDLICKPCMVVIDKLEPSVKILEERIKKNGTSFEVEMKKLGDEVKADDPTVPFRICHACEFPHPRAEITTVAGRLLCKDCNDKQQKVV